MKDLIISIYDEGYGGVSAVETDGETYKWTNVRDEALISLYSFFIYGPTCDRAKDSYCELLINEYRRIIICDNGGFQIYENGKKVIINE